MPSITRLVPVLLAVGLLLTGCDALPSRYADPSASPTPRFASDEEALAAAEKAYAEFMAVSDQVVRDGGTNPERLKPFMTDAMYAAEAADMEKLRTQGFHGVGRTRFEMELRNYDDRGVAVYVCDDQSESDLIDANGVSVIDPEGLARVPFEVVFESTRGMRLSSKEVWTGGGVC